MKDDNSNICKALNKPLKGDFYIEQSKLSTLDYSSVTVGAFT